MASQSGTVHALRRVLIALVMMHLATLVPMSGAAGTAEYEIGVSGDDDPDGGRSPIANARCGAARVRVDAPRDGETSLDGPVIEFAFTLTSDAAAAVVAPSPGAAAVHDDAGTRGGGGASTAAVAAGDLCFTLTNKRHGYHMSTQCLEPPPNAAFEVAAAQHRAATAARGGAGETWDQDGTTAEVRYSARLGGFLPGVWRLRAYVAARGAPVHWRGGHDSRHVLQFAIAAEDASHAEQGGGRPGSAGGEGHDGFNGNPGDGGASGAGAPVETSSSSSCDIAWFVVDAATWRAEARLDSAELAPWAVSEVGATVERDGAAAPPPPPWRMAAFGLLSMLLEARALGWLDGWFRGDDDVDEDGYGLRPVC